MKKEEIEIEAVKIYPIRGFANRLPHDPNLEKRMAYIAGRTKGEEEKSIDLADAQFIGFNHGKSNDIISLVKGMGLSLQEWEVWKKNYPTIILTLQEMKEVDKYLNALKND